MPGAVGDRRRSQASARLYPCDPVSAGIEGEPIGANLLFHDGNDRDLERTMQDLVENFMSFRLATELLRSRFELINTAIRERI